MGEGVEYQFLVSSIVSHRTKEPMVNLTVGGADLHVQLTTAQAYEIAFNLMRAANAAVGDAFLNSYLRNVVEIDEETAAQAMADFRRWREERGDT